MNFVSSGLVIQIFSSRKSALYLFFHRVGAQALLFFNGSFVLALMFFCAVSLTIRQTSFKICLLCCYPSIQLGQPQGFYRDRFEDLSNQWIANLYPDLDSLLNAHKEFLKQLFIIPAKKEGFDNWGLKEVRFGLREILYLKLFFPNAKILLLNRTLEDAFFSYRSFSKNMHWYNTWPDKPINNAYKFAKHHQRLNKDFLAVKEKFNDLFVEYDSLIADETTLIEIDNYCGIKCDRNAP